MVKEVVILYVSKVIAENLSNCFSLDVNIIILLLIIHMLLCINGEAYTFFPCNYFQIQTRVLVTHGITFLPHCDLIVVLKDGKIEDSGKYDELVAKEGAFADVIRSYLENEVGDITDEESEGESVLRVSMVSFTSSALVDFYFMNIQLGCR